MADPDLTDVVFTDEHGLSTSGVGFRTARHVIEDDPRRPLLEEAGTVGLASDRLQIHDDDGPFGCARLELLDERPDGVPQARAHEGVAHEARLTRP